MIWKEEMGEGQKTIYRAEEREGWTEAAKIDLRNYPSRSIQLRVIQHIEVQL